MASQSVWIFGAVTTAAFLAPGQCKLNNYPEEVVEWTGTTAKGGEYSCWVDFLDPMKPEYYPNEICVKEVTVPRSEDGEISGEELVDWTIRVLWYGKDVEDGDKTTASKYECLDDGDEPESIDYCAFDAHRADAKGAIAAQSVSEWCDIEKREDTYLRLVAPEVWTDETKTPAPPIIPGADGYVQLTCQVIYSESDDDNVRLNDWFAVWDGACPPGQLYNLDDKKCAPPEEEGG